VAAQRGVYTVSFVEQAIATASGDYDLFELDAAAEKPVEIVAMTLANKSEVGDAQDEMLSITVGRGHTTSGNGTSTTPRPLDASDGAASFAAETVGATIASAGTNITLIADTFNVRAGLNWVFPEVMRPRTSGTELLVVRLNTATADDLTLSGTLWVREL
jgi:hypothetical protein